MDSDNAQDDGPQEGTAVAGVAATRDWPLQVGANGRVVYDGIVIGGLDFTDMDGTPDDERTSEPRLTLDLGWLRHAGLRIRLMSDRDAGDNQRGGVFLER